MASGIRVIKKVDRLAQLVKRGSVVTERIIEQDVKDGVALMKQLVPVRTGALRAGIEAQKVNRGWGIRKGVEYFDVVDQGGLYFEGYHFSERTVESIRRGIDADMRKLESFLR